MHRLALGLGKTIGEIEATMGASELDDWLRYWQAEPWGTTRDNLHAALITSTLINVMGGGSKGRAASIGDFMFSSRAERAAEQTSASLNWLRAMAVPAPAVSEESARGI